MLHLEQGYQYTFKTPALPPSSQRRQPTLIQIIYTNSLTQLLMYLLLSILSATEFPGGGLKLM